jgi:regulator of sigma E protease
VSSNLPITIFAFVFTLGLVVIVHELGHFAMCKLFGIYVKTFSVGMGPKMLRKRWGETEYVLSLIPFGGYVKMAGEGLMEEIQDAGTLDQRKYPLGTAEGNREAARLDEDIPLHRHFVRKPAWQRFLVFVAGPLFNLVLAYVIYTAIIFHDGLQVIPITEVGAVAAQTPAAEAGLAPGDRIVSVDGKTMEAWDDILEAVVMPSHARRKEGGPVAVRLGVARGDSTRVVMIMPRWDETSQRWVIGMEPRDNVVGLVQRNGPADLMGLRPGDRILAVDGQSVNTYGQIATIINVKKNVPVKVEWERAGQRLEGIVTPAPAEILPDSTAGRIYIERHFAERNVSLSEALVIGHRATWATTRATVEVLGQFFGGKLGIEAVGGPIRIGQVAGEALRWSFGHLMQFIAFFSVNLFLLNLLPIPVLDGGHVLFLAFEAIRGKPVAERVQAIATQMGLIILLLFMTFVVVLDVWKVTGH